MFFLNTCIFNRIKTKSAQNITLIIVFINSSKLLDLQVGKKRSNNTLISVCLKRMRTLLDFNILFGVNGGN